MQPGALGIQQYPEANNLFLSQKAAMVMMGSWYTMNTLPDTMRANMEAASSTDDPFTMIPINFPDLAGTGNVGYMFSDIDYATAVATAGANVDAATKFAVWLGASQEGQQLIADSLNVVPVLKTATPNWDVVQLVNPEAQNEAVKDYLANCHGQRRQPPLRRDQRRPEPGDDGRAGGRGLRHDVRRGRLRVPGRGAGRAVT